MPNASDVSSEPRPRRFPRRCFRLRRRFRRHLRLRRLRRRRRRFRHRHRCCCCCCCCCSSSASRSSLLKTAIAISSSVSSPVRTALAACRGAVRPTALRCLRRRLPASRLHLRCCSRRRQTPRLRRRRSRRRLPARRSDVQSLPPPPSALELFKAGTGSSILSSSSRSFCAALGTVDVLADESALSVEREHARVLCSAYSRHFYYVRLQCHEIVRHSVVRMCIVLSERQHAVLKVYFWCS